MGCFWPHREVEWGEGGLVFFGFSAGFLFGLFRVCLFGFLGYGFWLGCRASFLVGFLLRLGGL